MSDRGTLSICVPNARGQNDAAFTISLVALGAYLGGTQQSFRQHFVPNSVVHHARQTCVTSALEHEDVSHILFLDDDMTFTPEDFAALHNEFIEHDLDFLAALAFTNTIPTKPCVFGKLAERPRWGKEDWWHIVSDYPGITRRRFDIDQNRWEMIRPYGDHRRFKCEATGMGMVLMSRRMLDAMRRDAEGNIIEGYQHFQCTKMKYPHEDVAFCFNAMDKGFTIWCDSRVRIGHISRDKPIIDENTYLAQGDAIEYHLNCPRLRFDNDDSTTVLQVPAMETLGAASL